MENARFFILVILFICEVYFSDTNASIVKENQKIRKINTVGVKSKDYGSNATNTEKNYDDETKNQELIDKADTITVNSEDELSNITNIETTDNESDDAFSNKEWELGNKILLNTRRILNGHKVEPGARPYMVYLNLTEKSLKVKKTTGWLCGGVIVHKEYVITSAACVEDGDKFYVISGTVEYSSYKTKSPESKQCISENKRRVIWKCVPKYYHFSYIDDVKWSANDIAVVKVDRPFKLGEVERGCQFAAEKVPYNNISLELEEPGTKGWVLGWGSSKYFREEVYRRSKSLRNSKRKRSKQKRKRPAKKENKTTETEDTPYQFLQEADVILMEKDKCVEQSPPIFHDIIQRYMICTGDINGHDHNTMSPICSEKYANCTVVGARRELAGEQKNNQALDDNREVVDPGRRQYRRDETGGFCEYDHGGPLVVRYQGKDHVIGVISVCRVDSGRTLCHGPFLYTSVFANRQFLSCAIHNNVYEECRRVFRSGLTYTEWTVHWGDDDE